MRLSVIWGIDNIRISRRSWDDRVGLEHECESNSRSFSHKEDIDGRVLSQRVSNLIKM